MIKISLLENVTTVRGYAVYLGLDPTDRSVLRKIQRQCERGDLIAKLDQGAWLIQVPQKQDEGAIIMRNWENMNEVYYDGMTLNYAGYGNDKNYGLNNHKVSLFYVNQVPMSKSPNHFSITWDFNEFLTNEAAGTFEWPSPHAVVPIKEKDKQNTIDYFYGAKFTPYGREVLFNGQALTIINRPVEFAPEAGSLKYYAGAVDTDGRAYRVYWNMFNVFEPVEVEMTVDKSRYCKHCLQKWTLSADTTKCKHEWVLDSE